MKKPSVTVVICAYNEESTLPIVLKALLSQAAGNFVMKQILVLSDGSSDATAENSRRVHDRRIRVIEGKKRRGLTARLNQAFRLNTSDIVVKIDADVVPTDNTMIMSLIKPFTQNSNIGLVSGSLFPYTPDTFVEKTINTGRIAWDYIRSEMKKGKGVYACTGGLFAISRKLAHRIIFPADVWADVGYIYFTCMKHGFGFTRARNASVWFQLPKTVKDYIYQSSRYRRENSVLKKYFPDELVEREYAIPASLLMKAKFTSLVTQPVYTVSLYILNLYAARAAAESHADFSNGWDSIRTTKKGNRI